MRDVIITGSGRSGTSLAAGTLAGSGTFVGGRPHAANAANPKGFFETHEVNGINEALLAPRLPRTPRLKAGQRWLGIPASEGRTPVDPALDAAIRRLTAQRPFCFKDPRFVWTLDAWRPHLVDPVVVCVFREPARTASSIVTECGAAPYLAGVEVSYERALELWTAMYRRVVERAAREPGWRFIHYDQLLTPEGLDRLAAWTGASLARDFPDPALKRSRAQGTVALETAAVYDRLCAFAGFESASSTVRVALPKKVAAGRNTAPELSIVLCTYNRKQTLARSLAAFQEQTAAGRYELVVVDDGSTDGTRELLDGLEFKVPTTVVHRANGKLAAARNTGIEAARGRILLFVNDDTIAFPELVEEHLAAHAGLAPRRAAVLGTFEQPAAALDNALMRHLEHAQLVFRYADLVSGETYDHNRFWTCNVSVHADAVREAGGFDESFQHYGAEDIDLGVRLEALDVRVVYHDRARAQHEHVLDFGELKHRTRLVGKAFVRLFKKHPACLAHPDWSWMRGESLRSLDRQVAEGRARCAGLEDLVRELARVDLGALEGAEAPCAASSKELVERLLATLGEGLGELNVHWWREGFADGLREFGLSSFEELEPTAAGRPRAPGAPRTHGAASELPVHATSVTASDVEVAAGALEALRALAQRGEVDVATIDAVRLGSALAASGAAEHPELASLYVATLCDLGVLRFRGGDARGAKGLLEAAFALDPEHELVRLNLLDVEAAGVLQSVFRPSAKKPEIAALPTDLNPWVEDALAFGEQLVGLAGKDVIEIGGAVPEEAVRKTGAASWRAGYPTAEAKRSAGYEVTQADARSLAYGDASCDVVFSSCAFEHVGNLDRALAEIARVLRPGGALVTSFAPIWSCSVGHHLWERDDDGALVAFDQPVLPRWAHLLLSEDEVRWYLGLVFSAAVARRSVNQMFRSAHINRVFEADFRRLFAESGLDPAGMRAMEPWGNGVPTDAMRSVLKTRYPNGGDFSIPGFVGTLVKAPARASVGAPALGGVR